MDEASIEDAIIQSKKETPRRRIKFVPAQYEYKQNLSESFVFTKTTDSYAISYGNKTNKSNSKQSHLFDMSLLNSIKTWSRVYNSGIGVKDELNRGFAFSIIYSLKACPVFRQNASNHSTNCKKIGCSLCKIYKFYDTIEKKKEADFPLEMRLFYHSWKPGDLGDSSEFLIKLLDILQTEELSTLRSFGDIDQFSTSIGQIFRISYVNRFVCDHCGRVRLTNVSEWTIQAPFDIMNEIDSNVKHSLSDNGCDACQHPIYIMKEYKTLPIILTFQVSHWNHQGEFRKRNLDMQKLLSITVNSVMYKLCAFTTYNGFSNVGGKFGCVFLSASGIWNQFYQGKVTTISASDLCNYQPQVLFFTRDEPNSTIETFSAKRIVVENRSDSEELPDTIKDQKVSIDDSLKNSILSKLSRGQDSVTEKPEVIVVDSTTNQKRKAEKPQKETSYSNPMQMLLKASSSNNTGTWGSISKTEVIEGWKEEKLDEWDQSLDKGHVRKVRNKKLPPVDNPFDNVPAKRRPGDFNNRDNRRKPFNRK